MIKFLYRKTWASVDLDICVNPVGKKLNIHVSAQVPILACAVKDIVFTRGVKELVMQGMQDKDVICMLNQSRIPKHL